MRKIEGKMCSIRADFKEYIEAIETNRIPLRKISFKNAEELQRCVNYFFDRAAANIGLSAKFAAVALKLKGLFPENEKWLDGASTLKKALISLAKAKTIELIESLNSASCVSLAQAKGTCKFFGELFNIGFIYAGPLLSCAGCLEKINTDVSRECLKMIEETVREKLFSIQIDEVSAEQRSYHKSLVDLMKRVQNDPKYQHSITEAVPRSSEQQFPSMNGETSIVKKRSPVTSTSPSSGGESSNGRISPPSSTKEKLTALNNLLKKLNTGNAQEIKKKIKNNPQHFFDSSAMHLFYELLVETALVNDIIASTIVEICQLYQTKNAEQTKNCWGGGKTEDAKDFIAAAICKNIEKGVNVFKLLKAFMEKSFFDIETLQTVLDTLILHIEDKSFLTRELIHLFSGQGHHDFKQLIHETCVKILGTKKMKPILVANGNDEARYVGFTFFKNFPFLDCSFFS